jgi:hypothetical protein
MQNMFYLVLLTTMVCLSVVGVEGESPPVEPPPPPRECPIKGQKYYSGPPDECAPCDGTCKQPVVACPLICKPGCACPNGEVVKKGRKCVKPEQCSKKGCREGGNKYKNGESWTCSDGCNTCRCINGSVASTKMACPKKGCMEGGNEYNDGESWTCSDGCNTCFCINGNVASTLMACPIDFRRKR